MDPPQRLLMTHIWLALEDAGYAASSLSGTNTGIFVGTTGIGSGYGNLITNAGIPIEGYSATGIIPSIGPNRMSYLLNLHGPSEPIETACSSSLVAIHRGVAAMQAGECDQVIVGGVNTIVTPDAHISFNKSGMLSTDGRCKTFSKEADGYVRSEGIGILFLKRMDDAERDGDHIYGLIRSTAENHGGRANSLRAPNPKAQADLLIRAYRKAGIDPRTVTYIEAHGTGTALGDPIEIDALKSAFRTLDEGYGGSSNQSPRCGVGSVKSNIGHLEFASGVAGVIKVLLQMKHKRLVKSLHCDEINPYIDLRNSPFYLVRDSQEWVALQDSSGRAIPRRAGVSSFGFGGVNAHIVLEEYVGEESDSVAGQVSSRVVVPLSAKNKDRLREYADSLLKSLQKDVESESSVAFRALSKRLERRMISLLSEMLEVDDGSIEADEALSDYGVENFHLDRLCVRLQQDFEVDISPKVFDTQKSLSQICATILGRHIQIKDRLSQLSSPVFDKGERGADVDLVDLAYTLQVGREAMDERLAPIVGSVEDLQRKLRGFIAGNERQEEVYLGQVKENRETIAAFTSDDDLYAVVDAWMNKGKYEKLASFWVKGLNFDWSKLYRGREAARKPRRIRLPTYPFAKERYWVPTGGGATACGCSGGASAEAREHGDAAPAASQQHVQSCHAAIYLDVHGRGVLLKGSSDQRREGVPGRGLRGDGLSSDQAGGQRVFDAQAADSIQERRVGQAHHRGNGPARSPC